MGCQQVYLHCNMYARVRSFTVHVQLHSNMYACAVECKHAYLHTMCVNMYTFILNACMCVFATGMSSQIFTMQEKQ